MAQVDHLELETNKVFTPRTETVLAWIAKGLTNSAIADKLGLQVKTVDHYLTTLCAEVGIPAHSQYSRRVVLALWWWHRNNTWKDTWKNMEKGA